MKPQEDTASASPDRTFPAPPSPSAARPADAPATPIQSIAPAAAAVPQPLQPQTLPPAPPPPTPLPRLDIASPRFAEQVGIAIARRPGGLQPGDELVLQIEPADLGRIRVELHFAPDGKLEAVVSADQARVLDQLRLHSAELHRGLVEVGGRSDIAPPRFETRQEPGAGFAQQSGNAAGQQPGGGQGGNGHGQSQNGPRASFAYAPDPPPDLHRDLRPLRIAAGRLDLIA